MCPEDVDNVRSAIKKYLMVESPGSKVFPTLDSWTDYAWNGIYLNIPDDLTPPISTTSPTSNNQLQSQQVSSSNNFWRNAGYSSLIGYIDGEYPVGTFQQIVSVTQTTETSVATYKDPIFYAYVSIKSQGKPGVNFYNNQSSGIDRNTLLSYYNDYIGAERGEVTQRDVVIQRLASKGILEKYVEGFKVLSEGR